MPTSANTPTKTATKTAAKAPARKKTGSVKTRKAANAVRAASRPMDAIRLLKADHREVEDMFKKFEDLEDSNEKRTLADMICKALTVHAQIEEEIFYPAAREGTEDDDLLDEAEVEHASAKQLISEIQAMNVEDHLFDAKVKVLGEYVHHHVQEEEKEMFPECRDAKVDLVALGAQLAERKSQLMAGQ